MLLKIIGYFHRIKVLFSNIRVSVIGLGCQNCNTKLTDQIVNYIPRNRATIQSLFSDFQYVMKDFTIIPVVGLPDPYDAMFLEHEGKFYIVFDLILFTEGLLNEDYSCRHVLTHELMHIFYKTLSLKIRLILMI